MQNEPLLFTNWIDAGLGRIRDCCHEVTPGFYPFQQFCDIIDTIPSQWKQHICMHQTTNQPSLQPCFVILNSGSNQPPMDLLECKTSHFYRQLHCPEKPVISATDYWERTLMPGPVFASKQWNMFDTPLVTNKEGDDYRLGVESRGDDKVLVNNSFDVIKYHVDCSPPHGRF